MTTVVTRDQQLDQERAELRKRNEAASFIGLWDYFSEITRSTSSVFQPHVWRWSDARQLLFDALELVSLEQADRRAFILSNPGVFPKHFTTNMLYVAYQIVGPGESAAVHRHTPSASRFVIEGSGGFTVIEGEKCVMNRGDLIITPQGTWHDHGNDGEEPALWVDVLDLPLVDHLGAVFFEFDYEEEDPATGERKQQKLQTVTEPGDHSENLYGASGLLPAYETGVRGKGNGTSKFVYRWADTLAALKRLGDYEGSPYDGVIMRYADPMTGGPTTDTMDFTVQQLRPGESTRSHRHTSSTVYCCLEGSGRSEVGGMVLEWGRNDTFVVPSWAWHRHMNSSSDTPAILYAVTDAPVAQRLALYREEAREDES
ncbi:MAG: cupin domain-containing protein [Acidimicrobiales bacterium]